MSSEKTADLLQFLKNNKWESYIEDTVVQDHVEKIKKHIEQNEGKTSTKEESDVDVSGSKRVKLVVVGDGAVGKTSLLIRFATGEFPTEYLPTVFENYTAQMKRESEVILLHLWDTAGQEDYDRLRPLSYPGADVVLLCFSTISQASFDAIKEKWAPEIQHYIPNIPHILVGTKIDLREAKHPDPNSGKFEPITGDQGQALADEINATKYMEVSSKTGQGLEEVFREAVNQVLDQRETSNKVGGSKGKESRQKNQKGKDKKKDGCVLL